jgi:nuclear RNA export factor
MPPAASRRGGGIRKHQQVRRDRDGDLVMGAAPRVTATKPYQKPQTGHARSLVELKVTGWTEASEVEKLTKFLDRHAAKRSTGGKSGGLAPAMIKRSRVNGDMLVLSVRPEDVPAFSKINGFSFPSAKGQQKLHISGPGVRSRSPTTDAAASTSSNGSEVAELIELMKGFLNRRYTPSTKLLNLSSIADDEQINSAGMFASAARQSKFIPVLMTIIDQQLQTADAKRDAIESVTLSNNNLPNLNLMRDLAITLPHVKNLDLSNNKFADIKDIMPFKNKFRSLEHLVLTGNPLETKSDLEQEMLRWYPRLRILNGKQVRSDAQIARLDAPKETPTPSYTALWLDDSSKIAEKFLIDYFQGFDSDRNALALKYYDQTSVFTMHVNARAKGGAGNQHDRTPWDSYLTQSRNLKFIHGKRTRFARKFRGTGEVIKAFSNLPPTRHPSLTTDKFSIDCQPQPGLPDPSGQYPGVGGLMVIVHGEYEEHRTAKGADEIVRRAFDRTFTLGPGGPTGVRVVSDMLSLRPGGGIPAWIPQGPLTLPTSTPSPELPGAPSGLTPDQEAMVLHVHQATKLTLDMAAQCLQAGNWDLDAAAQIFNTQKANLPAEAFVTS